MSVIESDHRAIAHRRLIPIGVQLAPEFLKEAGAAVPGTGHMRAPGMLGLLFGRTEYNVVSLEAFSAITADCASDAESCERERLERALDETLFKSKLRAEAAWLELVGWCSFQSTDDLADMPNGCIQFHTARFRRASDVLLIVKPGRSGELSGRVYARASELPLAPGHYASGRVAINLDRRVTRPVYVSVTSPAESANPGLYFQTYETARALEKAERKEARREALRRMIEWRTPQWLNSLRPEAVMEQPNQAAISTVKAATPQMAIVRPLYDFGPVYEPSGRWWRLFSAAALLLAVALSFVFLSSRPRLLGSGTVHVPGPQNGGLGLRVHVQGEGFLVTWDREAPALRSATKGVLRIQDGSDKRSTDLQPAELANGSIVYRPASDDVNFLLIVYAADGSVAREDVRALDGPNVSAAGMPQDRGKAVRPATRRTNERKGRTVQEEQARNAMPARRSEAVPNSEAPEYTAPQPLKIVMPDTTGLAPASLPEAGKIDVEVDVDEQGRVVAARIPPGAPRVSTAVARAAIAAAKQWRFEPAKLYGHSVASKHHVIFDFHAGAR